MEQEMITVCKKPGIKNCVRINTPRDIPDFLKDVIKVEGDQLVLDCLEGVEKCPLGSVIAFEKLESGKMNVWNKANWKETTTELNGVFYELPKPNAAVKVTDSIPEGITSALGGNFTVLPNGDFQMNVGWGLVTCAPNNGYVVIYGKNEDGSLDLNFVTKGTPTFEQYYVIDDKGNIVESLAEYDQQLEEKQAAGIKM